MKNFQINISESQNHSSDPEMTPDTLIFEESQNNQNKIKFTKTSEQTLDIKINLNLNRRNEDFLFFSQQNNEIMIVIHDVGFTLLNVDSVDLVLNNDSLCVDILNFKDEIISPKDITLKEKHISESDDDYNQHSKEVKNFTNHLQYKDYNIQLAQGNIYQKLHSIYTKLKLLGIRTSVISGGSLFFFQDLIVRWKQYKNKNLKI